MLKVGGRQANRPRIRVRPRPRQVWRADGLSDCPQPGGEPLWRMCRRPRDICSKVDPAGKLTKAGGSRERPGAVYSPVAFDSFTPGS
jgi:hypothetical protein